jgi:hypothetical protein
MGSVAKSYCIKMRKGFLIYEEMRKYLTIYEEAVSHIRLCNRSLLNFHIYGEIFFSFLSVYDPGGIIRKRQSHVTLMVNFKVPG